jgi:hypothetical protein
MRMPSVRVGLMLRICAYWVLEFLSCPLIEEEKSRSHYRERDASWILRGLKGLHDLHSSIEESDGEERC